MVLPSVSAAPLGLNKCFPLITPGLCGSIALAGLIADKLNRLSVASCWIYWAMQS